MPPGIDVCMVLVCNQVETAAAKVKMEPPSAVQPPKKRGVFTVNLKDFSCTMHGFGEPETVPLENRWEVQVILLLFFRPRCFFAW